MAADGQCVTCAVLNSRSVAAKPESRMDWKSLKQRLRYLARKHLRAKDRVEINTAFSEGGHPRFDAAAEHGCGDLFAGSVNQAQPPPGAGQSEGKITAIQPASAG